VIYGSLVVMVIIFLPRDVWSSVDNYFPQFFEEIFCFIFDLEKVLSKLF
jgi:hypothetical protein